MADKTIEHAKVLKFSGNYCGGGGRSSSSSSSSSSSGGVVGKLTQHWM